MKGFKKETISFFVRAMVSAAVFGTAVFVSLAADDTPPKISDILVGSVTENSASVTWKTDDVADSQINYGMSNNYGIIRNPVADKKIHQLDIKDLEPATTYHFRVLSADEFGNQTVSGDFTLTTKGVIEKAKVEKVVEQKDQQEIVSKVLALINQITDPEALTLVDQQVADRAEKLLLAPMIIGTPHIEEVGENYAIITWKTDRESSSLVSFVSDDAFNPDVSDPYAYTIGDTNERVLEHKVEINGLKQATKYHFKVSSEDVLGLTGKGRDEVFTTTSPIPVIRDLKITKVEETSATFSWNTTVPAAGFVEYTNLSTGQVKIEGSPELISGHTVRLADLVFGTKYSAIIRAENAAGDKVVSDPVTFVTVRDKFPPVISKVTNESTLYPSNDNKIQTIVSWETDELAYCQFFYRQGLAASGEELSLQKDKAPATDHVQVVVEFLPATVYKFWTVCEDQTKNIAKSEDFVLFTPSREKSIIDIILENFQGAFGWLKNIKK